MYCLKNIFYFARKWYNELSDTKNISNINLFDMGESFVSLGFQPDSTPFAKQCKTAFTDDLQSAKIIHTINSYSVIGNALYAYWLELSQSGCLNRIFQNSNVRFWFVCMLKHLMFLTEKYNIFHGTPKTMTLSTHQLYFYAKPKPDSRVTEILTLEYNGFVSVETYSANKTLLEKKHFQIDAVVAQSVLQTIATYFSKQRLPDIIFDTGNWILTIGNTNDEIFECSGCLGCSLGTQTVDFSYLIRTCLNLPDLCLFDGNPTYFSVEKITLYYHKTTKIPHTASGFPTACAEEHYFEKFVVDRKNQVLTHKQSFCDGRKITHQYELGKQIETLMQQLDFESLFSYTLGNSEDIVPNPTETKTYLIAVSSSTATLRVIRGTFDRYGLPTDFDSFAQSIISLFQSYFAGEIFNPEIFTKNPFAAKVN